MPALVLLLFTLRLNRQDNELRKRRAEEARQKKAEEIGRFLEERLQKIEKVFLQEMSVDLLGLQTANFAYPELVFVGRITGEELQMPWDLAMSRASLPKNARPEELILRAQQSEFKTQNID